jgi:hypothetical protein
MKMSHVTEIQVDEVESYDVQALKQMCEDEGWQWKEGQRTYVTYAGHNSCEHAILIPGANYGIGVVKNEEGNNRLCWDNYGPGGLSARLGNKGEKIKQAYTLAKVKVTAKRYGKRFWNKPTEKAGWKRLMIEA